MTAPVNHHFVPQHFLRAWGKLESTDRVYRYRVVPNAAKFECKEVAIRSSASLNNLYEIKLPDGSFEIESSVVTPELDEFGHKIIDRIRNAPFHLLTDQEKRELAIYLVCLEARHPETLEKMNIRDQMGYMRESMKATSSYSPKIIDEVHDYLNASPSIGVMSLALFIKNERTGCLGQPFSDGLVSARVIEKIFDYDCLITSDFPCFRMGDYLKHFLCIVAVSPRKALIYSPNPDIKVFDAIPTQLIPEVVNLYTLGYAERAFGNSPHLGSFIEQHLGWARKFPTTEAIQEYVRGFIFKLFTQHGIA